MKLIFLFSLILSFVPVLGSSQANGDILSRNYFIPIPLIHLLEIDPLGNFILADDQDHILKLDTAGVKLYNVANNNLGHVHSIDAGNPFKILVFYRDQQTIIIYDRTLSEIHRIRLSDWKYQDVTAVCLSSDNTIWAFDGVNKVLIKMDDSGNKIISSDPFDIVRPPSPRPDRIYHDGKFLVLKEAHHPIALFDDFGKYLFMLDTTSENISVSGEMILLPSGTGFDLFDMGSKSYVASPKFQIGYSPDLLQKTLIDTSYEIDQFLLFGNKIFARDRHGVFMVNQ